MSRAHLARWCCLAVATVLPAVLAHPADSAPVPRAGVVSVAVATANVRVDLPPRLARADVARAARHTSVVLSQENWERRASRTAPSGWRAWQPAHPRAGCRGLATYWRAATWRPVHRYARVLVPGQPRCVSVLVLRHRASGLLLPVVNVHMLPGVDRGGHPKGRWRTYAEGMATAHRVAGAARIRWGRAVLAGDWNVDYRADRRVQWPGFPYAHLHRRWDTSWAPKWGPLGRPTHGHRRIDAVWWSEGGTRLRSAATIGRTYSDHRFLRVSLRIAVR